MACVALLAGVTLVVFSFLGGDPYRFDQYDLPKDVALGVLGVSCGVRLLSRDLRSAHCIQCLLIALVSWQISVVAFVGSHDVQTWRTLGTLGAATCVFVLARRVGALGAADLIYWSFAVIFATVADELAICPSTTHHVKQCPRMEFTPKTRVLLPAVLYKTARFNHIYTCSFLQNASCTRGHLAMIW